MSNIGRKPIDLGGVQVEVKGQEITYKGKNTSGTYTLPPFLQAEKKENTLKIDLIKPERRFKKFYGLHRALLANRIKGADVGFEQKIEINGLGFKAVLSGKKVTFALGYTNKIELDLPEGISLEVDKTGQKLTFNGFDKELIGQVCDEVRSMRPPEPYKGKGIKLEGERIIRKAGKAKSG